MSVFLPLAGAGYGTGMVPYTSVVGGQPETPGIAHPKAAAARRRGGAYGRHTKAERLESSHPKPASRPHAAPPGKPPPGKKGSHLGQP